MSKTVIAHQAIIPVRREAADPSEMVTQMLFGETAEVMGEQKNWLHVRLEGDDYSGWIDGKMVAPWPETSSGTQWMRINKVSTEVRCWRGGHPVHTRLVMGARVPVIDREGDNCIVTIPGWRLSIPEEVLVANTIPTRDGVINTSQKFLGTPYLWGGKTPWGVDCSGLLQTVFAIQGKQLKRDAWQQALEGENISFQDTKPGDVAFFQNDAGKVTHVGILLGDGGIRHAHGWVRDDFFTEEGIRNRESNKLTHKLHSIKTFF